MLEYVTAGSKGDCKMMLVISVLLSILYTLNGQISKSIMNASLEYDKRKKVVNVSITVLVGFLITLVRFRNSLFTALHSHTRIVQLWECNSMQNPCNTNQNKGKDSRKTLKVKNMQDFQGLGDTEWWNCIANEV